MAAFVSLTKTQWTVLLVLLFLNVACLYGVFIPLVVYWSSGPSDSSASLDTPEAVVAVVVPATGTRAPSGSTPSRTPAPAWNWMRVLPTTLMPTQTPRTLPTFPTLSSTTSTPAAQAAVPKANVASRLVDSQTIAELELNPRVSLSNQTTFFTSTCFGPGANPLQDRDNMAPADWSSSPDRKCIFGFRVNPASAMPVGRYAVFGGPDGQPRFYVVPPDAFASDTANVKQLSQLHLIVDPIQGCSELGSIGITADGTTYQCPACMLLKSGGMCLSQDGAKALHLPTNSTFILDADKTGGAMGWQGFPAVFFKRDFSVYFTGKSGYAPPRVWFESTVDTLRENVRTKTTSEMSYAEIRGISSAYDGLGPRSNIVASVAPAEQPAQLVSTSPVRVASAGTGSISFRAPPETVLSSLVWTIQPLNNINNKAFLETNLCMDLNGERSCFTGVEDFAHCAFYSACVTGFSSLAAMGNGGYVATRYFPPGAAPVIHDPNVRFQFQAPDIGTILEMTVQLRVRNVNPSLLPYK